MTTRVGRTRKGQVGGKAYGGPLGTVVEIRVQGCGCHQIPNKWLLRA